jgi:nucleoside-diphosphate-sugar epimerase
MPTSLVTGGAGFLGSHLCDSLLAKGHRVICVDNLDTGSLTNVQHIRVPEFRFEQLDITSHFDVDEPVDFVYHMASPASPIDYARLPLHTLKVGAYGTHNTLGLAKAKRARSLLASTSEVYGDPRDDEPFVENARRVYGPTTQRRWAYADSKAMDEFLALAYHQERGLDCVIVRLFNTVGPRQSGQYGMVIPRMVERALAGEPIEIHGDGTQTRCFCHVADAIRALRGLLDDNATSGEIFNVGSTESIRIRDLAERIRTATGSDSELMFVPYDEIYRHGIVEEMLHRIPSIEKVGRAIGWAPTRLLDDILADVIETAGRPARA